MLWRWLYPISLVVVGAFQFATIRPGVVYNEDGCLFLAHARNLALAEPYSATNFIYTTETATCSPAEYPGAPLHNPGRFALPHSTRRPVW